MELREALSALRAGWWLGVLGLLLGGSIGGAVSIAQTPLYTSHTQLFVSTTGSASTSEVFQGGQFSQQRVASYARLLTGEELAIRVVDRLQLNVSSEELSEQITATAVANTVLLDIEVTDASAERAKDIANAIGVEFPKLVSDLEPVGESGLSPVKVTVSERADLPSAPSSPQTVRNVVLAALVGLLMGGAIAVLRRQLDRSVNDPQEAAYLARAPLIGTVLRDDALESQHLIIRHGSNRTAEDYRQLRTNLQFLNVDEPPKVIMVSSAVPSEGKTTVVVNLALALADAGRRVTIVEADLRRPKVTRYMGLVGGVGLTNLLAGTAELDEVAQRYGEGGVTVIAAGPTPPNPGELLSSSHMAALLDKIRGESDYVLVDAPPLLPVADSTGLAVMMDGVLLSVRYGRTTKDQLRQAATTLERVGAKTLGVILNIVPPKAEHAAAYGYGYSYDAEPARSGGKRRA